MYKSSAVKRKSHLKKKKRKKERNTIKLQEPWLNKITDRKKEKKIALHTLIRQFRHEKNKIYQSGIGTQIENTQKETGWGKKTTTSANKSLNLQRGQFIRQQNYDLDIFDSWIYRYNNTKRLVFLSTC